MTRTSKRHSATLDRITDALIEDILSAPDADLLAEAEVDDDDGVSVARAAFKRASKAVGFRKQAATKAVARRLPQAATNIRSLDPKTARDWLDTFIHYNPVTAGKLAATARSGEKLSDEDVYGMLETLQVCGVLERRGVEHGPR
jgi:hypothetical protein